MAKAYELPGGGGGGGSGAGAYQVSQGMQQWATGQNTRGTENGWDNPFFTKFLTQYQEAEANGTAQDYFKGDKATGVALQDGQTDKAGRTVAFGDMYNDGEYLGNLYDQYDRGTANMIMGRLTLGPQELQHINDPNLLDQQVQQRREDTNYGAQAAANQRAFGENVDKVEQEWKQSGADNAAVWGSAGAGALGGAGIGMFAGPAGAAIGAGVGAVVGGIAGALNKDELVETAARGEVTARMADAAAGVQQDPTDQQPEGWGVAGQAERLKTWSGLVQGAVVPARNLLHGIYEASRGAVGDGEADWYAVDDRTGQTTRPGWLTAADIGAGFVEGLGQFTNPIGQAAYMSTMGGQIAGQVGELAATGGQTFDDRSASFDNIFTDRKGDFDLASAAAGLGNIGIDVLQMGLGAGLGRVSAVARGEASALKSETEVLGGRVFTKDAEGAITGMRPSVTALAPSEGVQFLSTRIQAMRNTAKESGALTYDDFYKAAKDIEAGGSKWKAMLVNGFGEGTEEAVQALLEPWSHQEDAKPEDVALSYFTGFAMGAGMSAGAYSGQASQTKRLTDRVNALREARGEKPFTADEVKAMPQDELAKHLQRDTKLKSEFEKAAGEIAQGQKASGVANQVGYDKFTDAARAIQAQDLAKQNKMVEGTYVMTQVDDSVVGHQVHASIRTIADLMDSQVKGLREQQDQVADAAQADRIKRVADQAEDMAKRVREGARLFYDKATTRPQRAKIVRDLNLEIEQWYDGVDAGTMDADQGDRARAVTLIMSRDPNDNSGSWQAMMPQISLTNSGYGADNLLQVSHAILTAIGGDFDGDKLRQLAREVLDDEAFTQLRTGANLRGSRAPKDFGSGVAVPFVNLMQRGNESTEFEALGRAFRMDTTSPEYSAADAALAKMKDALISRYAGKINVAKLMEILQGFDANVRRGDGDSKTKLLEAFAMEAASEMALLSRQQMSNEWFEIDYLVTANLQMFQRAYAALDSRGIRARRGAAVQGEMESNVATVRSLPGANFAVTMMLRLAGSNLFRMFQKLHYSVFTSNQMGASSKDRMGFDELVRMYELTNSGMTESALEEIGAKDLATARVRYQLARIVSGMGPDLKSNVHAQVLIANMSLPDVDLEGNVKPGNLSLVQWLLREAARTELAKFGSLATTSPELVTKYTKMMRMTPAQAMVEVFGTVQVIDLLGPQAKELGLANTVDQLRAAYVDNGSRGRQDLANKWRRSNEYGDRKGKKDLPFSIDDIKKGEVSAYRSLVDAVLEVASDELTYDRDTRKVGGRLGRQSNRKHKELLEGLRALQQAMASVRHAGRTAPRTVAEWKAALDLNPALGRSIMNLIPNSDALGVFRVVENEDGSKQLVMADWIFEMLLIEDPEKAAMHYFRHQLIASWRALGHGKDDFARRRRHELKDTMHVLMYDLVHSGDEEALLEFERLLFTHTTVDEFIADVNERFLGEQAPITAWVRDVSLVDPSATSGGWSQVLAGTEMRDAITAFQEKSLQFNKEIQQEILDNANDAETIKALELGYKLKKPSPTDANYKLVRRWEHLVDMAAKRPSVLSAVDMMDANVMLLSNELPNATDKGLSPLEILGRLVGMGNAPIYASWPEMLEASMTSYATENLGVAPESLAQRSMTFMNREGNQIEWKRPTAEEIFKLWRDQPAARAFIRSFIAPSAYESTSDGKLIQKFYGSTSLTSLLERGSNGHMQWRTEANGKGGLQKKANFLAYLSAAAMNHGAKRFAVERVVSDITVAHTSSAKRTMTANDNASEVQQTYGELADVYLMAGALNQPSTTHEWDDGNGNTLTGTWLDEVLWRRNQLEQMTELFKKYGTTDVEELKVLELGVQKWMVDILGEAADSRDQVQMDHAKAVVDVLKKSTADNSYRAVARRFKIKWSDAVEAEQKKRMLTNFVRQNPLLDTAPYAMKEIAKVMDEYGETEPGTQLPLLSQKEWDQISMAAFAYTMESQSTTTLSGRGVVEVDSLEFEDIRLFDATYTYLMDSIFDPALVQAATEYVRDEGLNNLGFDVSDLTNALSRGIFRGDRFGQWTGDIARQSVANRNRLDAAAAGEGIAKGGIAPRSQATESAATERTTEMPNPTMARDAVLTWDELKSRNALFNVPLSKTLNRRNRMSIMNGRFATGVSITYTDATGKVVTEDAWNNPRTPFQILDVRNPAIAASGYRIISIAQLRKAWTQFVPEGATNASMTVSYFDPADLPAGADWANNLFFEGVAESTGADVYPSLNAALWFLPGGLDQLVSSQSLGSNKKGYEALYNPAPVKESDYSSILGPDEWKTDLALVLREKAHLIITHENPAKGQSLSPDLYNAFYKRMKLRHVVRGKDADGNYVVWTADQVIAAQVAGTDLPTEMELVLLSDEALRDLLGETGTEGSNDLRTTIPGTEVAPSTKYTGELTAENRANLPGLWNPADVQLHEQLEARLGVQSGVSSIHRVNKLAEARHLKGISVRHRRASEIAEARRETKYDYRQQGLKHLKDAQTAVANAQTMAIDWYGQGLPTLNAMGQAQVGLATNMLNNLSSKIAFGDNEGTAWLYQQYGGGQYGQAGVITGEKGLLDSKNRANDKSPADIVIVDLASFGAKGESLATQQKKLGRVLQTLMSLGVKIHLMGSDAGGWDLLDFGSVLLEETLYQHIPGQAAFFEPVEFDAPTANARARASMLLETGGIETDNFALSFVSDKVQVDENSAIITQYGMQKSRRVAITLDLLPTGAFHGFSLPVDPDHIKLIRDTLKGYLDNGMEPLEKVSALASDKDKLTNSEKNSLRRAVQHAYDNLQPNGLYAPRSKFSIGDLVPMYNETTGQTLFYRHGHDAPPSINHLNQQFAVEGNDGGEGNVAIYSTKTMKGATTHDGEVLEFTRRGKYGMAVKLAVPLQVLGDKTVLERNGMKLLSHAMPASVRLPKVNILGGVGIDFLISLPDSINKHSFDGMVTNFRNAFAYLGVDNTDALATSLFGDASQDSRAKALAVLKQLEKFSQRLDPVVVQRLMRDTNVEMNFAAQLFDELDPAALGLSDNWFSKYFQDVANRAPEDSIAGLMIMYMLAHGAKAEHVLRSGGFGAFNAGAPGMQSRLMPRLFTDALDEQAVMGSSLRKFLFDGLNDRLQQPDKGRAGYVLQEDWKVQILNDDPQFDIDGYLQFSQAFTSGDNPRLNAMAAERSRSQGFSPTRAAFALSTFGAASVSTKASKGTSTTSTKGEPQTGDELRAVLRQIPDEQMVPRRHFPRVAEREYLRIGRLMALYVRQGIDTKKWGAEIDKDTHRAQVAEFKSLKTAVANKYGLSPADSRMIDYWIRAMLGSPVSPVDRQDGRNDGDVSFHQAMDALNDILWNAENGYLPVMDSEIPIMHASDLRVLFDAAMAKGFQLKLRTDDSAYAKSWDEWVKVSLGVGQIPHEHFDVMFLTATDGMLHTYRDLTTDLKDLPISQSPYRQYQVYDPEMNKLILSVDPRKAVSLQMAGLKNSGIATIEDMFGGQRIGSAFMARKPTDSAVAARRKARIAWRKAGNVRIPMNRTFRDLHEQGSQFIDETTTSNAFMRTITNLRVAMALTNPLLWVSAGFELFSRSALENAANIITGDSTGWFTQVTGGTMSHFTPDELKELNTLYGALGRDQVFRSMLNKDLAFKYDLHNAKWLERATARWAKAAGAIQDPTYGMISSTLGRRYVETVIRGMQESGTATSMSPLELARHLAANPLYIQQTNIDLHNQAEAAIMNNRSLKATPLSLFLRGIYEPLSNNPKWAIAAPSTLFLKLPLMFSGYGLNVAMNLTGMQAVSDFVALNLHGRKNVFAKAQSWMAGGEYRSEESNVIDMTQVLESIDLTNAIVRSGITHSQFMAYGLMAGSLGLTGEDDEDRRRRRAAKYKGFAYMYDPRSIVNDFRNADAVFLDQLPMGLDVILGEFFKVTKSDSPDGAKSMAEMHWIMKQFLSPLMGIERYFNTGNAMDIWWGFEDAINSFPLINMTTVDDSHKIFSELMESASTAEGLGGPDNLRNSYDLVVRGVFNLERMLFENSFINSLYTGMDKYDRDPWVLPEKDNTGAIIRDRLDVPRPTKALEKYLNDDGDVAVGSVNRDWWDATLHGFAENRATLALFSSLFTGFNQSSMLRQNMAVKTREIDKDPLTSEEAKGLVLSLWDGKHEYLTKDGSRAVVQGLWKGTVSWNSPALEGVYIPFEQREQIQAELMKELVQEGKALGLTDYKAEQRMRALWYGSPTNPQAVALKDVVWSKQLNYRRVDRYNQLNTTYVIGPDGKPWATGVTRNLLANAFGFAPLIKYETGDISNMGVDGTLNSVDMIRGVNTGMRSLEKADDSWIVPTDEEIAKAQGASTGSSFTPYQPFSYGGGFGRRGGGGGGGGGGGYPAKLNPLPDSRAPYPNDIDNLNTNSPIIRRATIRRERIESQKGRLKPWQ